MNCTTVRECWELYHDSEGDSQLYLQVNDHLARCPACQAWFGQQQQFELSLTSLLRSGSASPELWNRLENQLATASATAGVGSNAASLLRYLAIAGSLLLLIAGWQYASRSDSRAADIKGLISVCHERLTGGEDRLQFESDSDLEVESYLKKLVSFPVRCPPRQDAGFAVRGGGVCTLGDAPAAYVHGLVGTEKVSVFILPRDRLVDFGREQRSLQRSEVLHRRVGTLELVLAAIDQNIVVVVGQESPERLERVVRAYGTYPKPHSHDPADDSDASTTLASRWILLPT